MPKSNISKKSQEILENYQKVKDTDFDFDRIALLFNKKDKNHIHQVISDRTCQDLDFEELFACLDRTCSKVGQQYLYYVLRTIPGNNKRSNHFEKIIDYFRSSTDSRDRLVIELSKLNDYGAYYIQRLIYGENLVKPGWYWIIPLLSGFSFATFILMFIYPIYPIFILIAAINSIVHFWNKNNILSYSNSIPQLIKLKNVSRCLFVHSDLLADQAAFRTSFNEINKITKKTVFLSWESRMSSEIGQLADYFLELIKATFLLEPIVMFDIVQSLEKRKQDIKVLLEATAKVDVAISISSFREWMPYYTKPSISDKDHNLVTKELYHPLIDNPVSNSLSLTENKSVLVSGSNMSGKTTFIRTIGINAILAQTINTACAEVFEIPRMKIHSAIRISDDLMSETSYYYEEVKIIKEMINESETEDQNLFLLDELFKGTNTIERVASGKAVLSYLNQGGNVVFASTHDLELTDFLKDTYTFYHFEEQVEEEKLTFDFKLKSGKWTNTNAIRILEVNGFPKEVTEEARLLAEKFRKEKT